MASYRQDQVPRNQRHHDGRFPQGGRQGDSGVETVETVKPRKWVGSLSMSLCCFALLDSSTSWSSCMLLIQQLCCAWKTCNLYRLYRLQIVPCANYNPTVDMVCCVLFQPDLVGFHVERFQSSSRSLTLLFHGVERTTFSRRRIYKLLNTVERVCDRKWIFQDSQNHQTKTFKMIFKMIATTLFLSVSNDWHLCFGRAGSENSGSTRNKLLHAMMTNSSTASSS